MILLNLVFSGFHTDLSFLSFTFDLDLYSELLVLFDVTEIRIKSELGLSLWSAKQQLMIHEQYMVYSK